MKQIIYRVTMDHSLPDGVTLKDFEVFVDQASDFDISADAPIGREPRRYDDYSINGGRFSVERVEAVDDSL